MYVTFKHLWTKSVTIQYPHVKMDIPKGSRNQLFNDITDCSGCSQCARACPVDCIKIETIKSFEGEELGITSDGKERRLHTVVWDLDMAKCCYCGLCTYPCPTGCLTMTDKYEYSKYNREDLNFHFTGYSPENVDDLRKRDEVRRSEKEAKKAAALKAKEAAAAKKAAGETPASD
jgi:NADH-quinone oxidoreductase subunit I